MTVRVMPPPTAEQIRKQEAEVERCKDAYAEARERSQKANAALQEARWKSRFSFRYRASQKANAALQAALETKVDAEEALSELRFSMELRFSIKSLRE